MSATLPARVEVARRVFHEAKLREAKALLMTLADRAESPDELRMVGVALDQCLDLVRERLRDRGIY